MKELAIRDNGADNKIDIHSGSVFKNSSIEINGNGCSIKIERCTKIDGLNIRITGDNKYIHIQESKKKIRNLKISSLRGSGQRITIGNSFGCGGVEIQMNDGGENCFIGSDCLFSWGIKIRTSDGHAIVDLASNKAVNLPKDIHIGNHVWVCEDAKILKGASIGNDCVVGGSAVVTKAFVEDNVIIAGFPATIVRRGITWDRRMPHEYNLNRDG